MEVSVVKLRYKGVKLAPEQVKTAEPTYGCIRIYYWHLKNDREDRRIKELVLLPSEDATCSPRMKLTEPVQTRLNGDSMVYVGVETIDEVAYPQAWFVRLDDREIVALGGYSYARAGKRAT